VCKDARVDWDDLRYVLALLRERTLSRAAARLGVTHTTVGRRLREIEEKLGARLFDSTPDGFMPTAAGHDVAEVAERTETEVHALESRLLGRDERLAGKLRVATMDMLFRCFHDAFTSFAARYPSVEVTVSATDREVSLLRREADVALRLTGSAPEYAVGRKVGRAEFAVYGQRALVERMGANATYGDFPWLHWDERLNMTWLDEWLTHNAPNARIAMRADFSTLLLREAVAAGIGVHFLATFDADGDENLVRIGPVQPAFGRDIWLLTLPDLRHTSRVRAFMDHVEERLRASRSSTNGAIAGGTS